MIFAYTARLVCLCFATFFIVNALAGFQLIFFSGRIVRFAERLPAWLAARLLLTLRILPFMISACVVLLLCLPSYLRFEPHFGPEGVGSGSVALAALGLAVLVFSAFRGACSLGEAVHVNRTLTRNSPEIQIVGTAVSATLIPNAVPLLAVSGILRPQLMISDGVHSTLTAEQLRLALKHESAHCSSRDNLKKLLLLLIPDPIPLLRRFTSIDEAWSRLSEWAADDAAVGDDPERAVTLAAALLCVARMGHAPRLSYLHTSLVSADLDLSVRVERLLNLRVVATPTRFPALLVPALVAAILFAGTCAVMFGTPILAAVHGLSEAVLR